MRRWRRKALTSFDILYCDNLESVAWSGHRRMEIKTSRGEEKLVIPRLSSPSVIPDNNDVTWSHGHTGYNPEDIFTLAATQHEEAV